MRAKLNELGQEPGTEDSAPSLLNPQNPWNVV